MEKADPMHGQWILCAQAEYKNSNVISGENFRWANSETMTHRPAESPAV
jgi:hypothetical protein